MTKKKPTKTRKAATKNFLVFTSNCGKTNQAEFVGDAATQAAAEKIAEKMMKPGDYYTAPKAVYVTKIVKTGKASGGVDWS